MFIFEVDYDTVLEGGNIVTLLATLNDRDLSIYVIDFIIVLSLVKFILFKFGF